MVARIYKPAKTAMQSGEGRTKEWVLEFAPASTRSTFRHQRIPARPHRGTFVAPGYH